MKACCRVLEHDRILCDVRITRCLNRSTFKTTVVLTFSQSIASSLLIFSACYSSDLSLMPVVEFSATLRGKMAETALCHPDSRSKHGQVAR
mmetsp:Transcript_55366/g.115810  ORF Transcript_55366/g.115810 Transcript_55366/m.115810 type:complete len:91 (-) Transcript_55366:23-295(-)